MDSYTLEHFNNWLDNYCHEDEKEEVRTAILKLMEDDPELINDHSWPELRNMAI